jgi:hypothetical protein
VSAPRIQIVGLQRWSSTRLADAARECETYFADKCYHRLDDVPPALREYYHVLKNEMLRRGVQLAFF